MSDTQVTHFADDDTLAYINRIERELAEAKKDSARLDWLDSVESSRWWHDNGNSIFDIPGRPGELRSAIDVAMEAGE